MNGKEGLDALFLYATEGIIVTDPLGKITRANPSAEKLLGYLPGELNGMTIESFVPDRYAHRHTSHRNKYNENPHPRSMGIGMDLFAKKRDGSEFPVEISLSPFSTKEGKFVVAFLIDITQRKAAEEKLKNYSSELEKQVENRTLILREAIAELERTKEELNESLHKEKELNELKSRFVSMASHEFRTPLATILSSLSLVTKYGEQNDMEKQNKHITRIKSSINNLTDILNDFLSVSRLEEGRTENNPEQFVLQPFLEEIVQEMQALCKQRQEIRYSSSGKDKVLLDKKLLKNILFNLISNAIKFSPENKTIEIGAGLKKNEVCISVKDQGIGIPAAEQKHLFERFFRAHNATHVQGTGLGLNIVAKYMELMNGQIDFTSEENKGTTFSLTIPQ